MPLHFKLGALGGGGKESRAVLLSKVTVSRVLPVEEGGLGRELPERLQAIEVMAVALSEDSRACSKPPGRDGTPGKHYHVTPHSSAATTFLPCYLYSTPAVPAKEQQASNVLKLSGKLLDRITFK